MTDNPTRQLFKLIMWGVFLSIVAWGCLAVWMKSEWMTFIGRYPEGWEGYTLGEFWAIFFFTLCGPCSYFLLMGCFQIALRKYAYDLQKYLFVAVTLILFLVGHMVFGLIFAWDFMRCGIFLCANIGSIYIKPYSKPVSTAATGFKNTIGASYFIVSACILVAMLINMGVTLRDRLKYMKTANGLMAPGVTTSDAETMTPYQNMDGTTVNSSSNLSVNGTAVTTTGTGASMMKSGNTVVPPKSILLKENKLLRIWGITGMLISVTFCFSIFTFYIPNNWEYYAAFTIARFAAMKATAVEALCSKWPEYTCPEIDTAVFRTYNLNIWEKFNLKLFPSNVFFFTMILSYPFVLTVLNSFHFTRTLFKKKFPLLKMLSLKEIFTACYIGIFGTLFFVYWQRDHNYVGKWPDDMPIASERWGRTFGQMANFFFGLLMFPAARNSPVLAMAGISWEAAIKYHRWLGVTFFIFTILHVIGIYAWYAANDLFPQELFNIPNHLPTSIDNFTVPMIQLIVWISFVTIGLMAIYEPFRRRHFDLFLMAHHFTYLVMIPAILWHAQASWEYILPAVIIWFFERCVRLYRSSLGYVIPEQVLSQDFLTTLQNGTAGTTNNTTNNTPVTYPGIFAVDRGAAGQFIEIRVPKTSYFDFQPGHYAFLNIMEISLLEWHPFTIMSAVHNSLTPEIGFCIKTMGRNTWTQSLYAMVKESQDKGVSPKITISIDGPYGEPIDYTQYDGVFLVGGGIGVTPCKSIFETLYVSTVKDALPTAYNTPTNSTNTTSSSSTESTMLHSDRYHLLSRVQLFFAARDAALFDLVEPCLQVISQSSDPYIRDTFHATLYVNNPASPAHTDEQKAAVLQQYDSHPLKEYIKITSASLSDDLRAAAKELQTDSKPNPKILVFVCGPEGLANAMEMLAHEEQWDFHTETFAL